MPGSLLGERGQVAVAGDAEHFQPLALQGVGQGADTEPGGVFGTEVFIDDDDREMEAHGVSPKAATRRSGS